MKALDLKLLRDLRLLWSQALTIALVVASGIGGFITSLSAVDSLALARDRFYAQDRFADVFASVKRAPSSLVERLLEVPGVADAQISTEQLVRVELPGVDDPIIGQLIGLDRRHPPRMNRVRLSGGQPLSSETGLRGDGSIEALVSEAFAQARGLKPGARLQALINGKRRTLVVAGTALSPEYVFAGLWGMPDTRGFGIFWIDRAVLDAAYDMEGAFNRVAFKLAPGASEQAVVDRLSTLLSPYGGRQAHGRAQQTSHAMLDNEIKEQRVLGTVLPVIFLVVAAFLLNVVVSRVVATQREQIAVLKALGYGSKAIASHYLKLVLLIVLMGLALGVFIGDRLGAMFTGLFAQLFHFSSFEHRIAPWLLAVSAAIALATAVAGALGAVLSILRLPPAEAMRPPAPGRYRRALLERLGPQAMAPALRMLARNLERKPLRSLLSVAGVAASVAIVVLGNFVRDAMDVVVDTQMVLSLRGDITLWTAEPVDDSVRHELGRLPHVKQVESIRMVPVKVRRGHHGEQALLRGYAGQASLYRLIDASQREQPLRERGLVLSERLAEKLDVKPGNWVDLEVLEGRERRLLVPVTSVVREMMGMNAYLEREALDRLLGEGDLASGFVLSVDAGAEAAVLRQLKAIPLFAGAWSKATMLRNMQEISARNVRIMSTVLTAFACVIAVGVVYNNARVALAERSWEMASLRVLGFTRGEVSSILLGEMAALVLLALPLGMLLGHGLTRLVVELLKSDQFHFPVVVRAPTYAWSALCVLAAAVASAMVVRRRVDKLDMVMALKTRE